MIAEYSVTLENKTKSELILFINELQDMLKENSAEIDLMAEYINYLSDKLVQATGKNELKFCDGNKCCKDSNYSCEQCIKQYFEQRATKND